MEEEGLVVEVRPGEKTARVKIERRAMCESCGKCGLMSRGMTDIVVNARNDAGAKVGERVLVELPARDVIMSAFIVYMIPLMAAAAGYVLGGFLHAAAFGSEVLFSRQGVQIATALGFFSCSFGIIRYYDRNAARSGRFLPLIVKTVGEPGGPGGTSRAPYGDAVDTLDYRDYGLFDYEEPPG